MPYDQLTLFPELVPEYEHLEPIWQQYVAVVASSGTTGPN
jgi:hypothetical protein